MLILCGAALLRAARVVHFVWGTAPWGAAPYFSSAKYLMVRTIWLV